MRVVLDTNVLLVAISEYSPFHWVIEELEKESYTICITTDILDEYAEVIGDHMGMEIANLTLEAILQLPNHIKIEKYYFWQLIEEDPDDNKFVDCAIASNAIYLVSEDKHLRKLKTDNFFKTKVIRLEAFKKILKK